MSKNTPFIYFFYLMSFILFMSSSQWFMMWAMLELNSIMFIPLLSKGKNNPEYAASVTYFLTQATASLILIFSVFNMELNNISNTCSPKVLMLLALLVKITSAPMHSWLPSIILSLTWTNVWMVLTLQKMMPLMLLMLTKPSLSLSLLLCISLSVSMGALMNLSQNNTKAILTYSSISHAGWFLTASAICQESWLFYFISYSGLLFILKMNLKMTTTQHSIKTNQTNSTMVLLTILSLGGLPPLMGFFPKLMIINSSMQMEIIVLALTLIIFSTLDLFIYARLSYQAMMNKKSKIMWMKKENQMSIFMVMIMNSLFSLVIIL